MGDRYWCLEGVSEWEHSPYATDEELWEIPAVAGNACYYWYKQDAEVNGYPTWVGNSPGDGCPQQGGHLYALAEEEEDDFPMPSNIQGDICRAPDTFPSHWASFLFVEIIEVTYDLGALKWVVHMQGHEVIFSFWKEPTFVGLSFLDTVNAFLLLIAMWLLLSTGSDNGGYDDE